MKTNHTRGIITPLSVSTNIRHSLLKETVCHQQMQWLNQNLNMLVIVNMFIYFFKTQKHILQIGSYIHDDSQIFFTGNYGHDLSNQRAQQYELFAKKLHPNDTYLFYANR